jgi:ADP-ribosyl-[dinitrogen reductase] hydrolase
MTLPISYNVVKSREAALWAFYRSNTFGKGALLAANLGDDADMTAAVYGQLAGSFYGADAIPAGWLGKLAMREFIAGMADALFEFRAELALFSMHDKFSLLTKSWPNDRHP